MVKQLQIKNEKLKENVTRLQEEFEEKNGEVEPEISWRPVSAPDEQNMTKYSRVSTSSEVVVQFKSENESFGSFELHTKGVGLSSLKNMDFNGQGMKDPILRWNLGQYIQV